jgi:asparagine synthase (glutamine-hydrolysing)
MCGICGFVAPEPVGAAVIRAMASLARHRGPDDEGYLLVTDRGESPQPFGGPDTPAAAYREAMPFAPTAPIEGVDRPVRLALGSRRLSILDLSVHGHQPMCTPDRRLWLAYNGEIYNYAELATELTALGYAFTSHSDTEVILAAYEKWGTGCLSRLNGMFAFAIYDASRSELFLARDRFGIKPLYYWFGPEGSFHFASEIKQFTAAPGWRARVNTTRSRIFLETGQTDDGDETMFEGVYHLLPGHCATIAMDGPAAHNGGRLRTQQWYTLNPAPFTGTFEDAAAEYRQLLSDAVRLQLRADVPVGSCLSGGIDSSSIVCLVNRDLRRQAAAHFQKTFSARAELPSIDESSWIDEVVNATGVDARFTTPTTELLQAEAPRLAWHQDEPIASTSFFAEWCVYRLVEPTEVTVMLDGQGADEALAGYHGFFAPYFADLVRHGRFVETRREVKAFKQRHGYGAVAALRGVARVLLSGDPEFASVRAHSYAQLTHKNLQMMLRSADRSSMAHSVESRVPFLDHRVVELSLSLPDEYKIGGGVTKRVLRAAMDGVLPDRIRNRVDKIAFETPEAHWMTGEERGWFRSQLQEAIERSQGFIPASTMIRFDAMAAGTRPFNREPWRAISFGQWMRAFSVGAPTRAQARPA